MPKDKVASSRKRIPLARFPTYAAALAAKNSNKDYELGQLQIRKMADCFKLVARVSTKENI